MDNPMLVDDEQLRRLTNLTTVVYAVQAVGLVFPVAWLVAVVINYVKRDDVAATWLESHFRWQIRSFWFGLAWCALGALTFIIVIGWAILVANYVWLIYRVVKGWLDLNDRKSMYAARPPA